MFGPERVVELNGEGREAALRQLAELAAEGSGLDAARLHQAVLDREALCSTGFGGGLAMPHVRIEDAQAFVTVLGRSRAGLPYDAVDGEPVHLLLLIAGPMEPRAQYQKLMARAAKFLKGEGQRLLAAEDLVTEAIAALEDY